MSEFMREAIPIIVMYWFVLLLGPFIAYAMWLAFEGDRLREPEVVADPATPASAAQGAAETAATLTPRAAEAPSAA